jgi:DNA-binding transcriptional ArsR family regulator
VLGRAVASHEPFDVALSSRVWARALGLGEPSSSAATISQSWTWLEEQRLVTSARRGRLREIRFMREDGSGQPYRHPGREGDYFKLPYSYWEGRYPGRLNMPAKALLLIALSLNPDFWLPHEHGARWYGLSRDTVSRGLSTLLRLGLLEVRYERKKAPLSPKGFTEERRYALRPPFGTGFPSPTETGASVIAARRRARQLGTPANETP